MYAVSAAWSVAAAPIWRRESPFLQRPNIGAVIAYVHATDVAELFDGLCPARHVHIDHGIGPEGGADVPCQPDA